MGFLISYRILKFSNLNFLVLVKLRFFLLSFGVFADEKYTLEMDFDIFLCIFNQIVYIEWLNEY